MKKEEEYIRDYTRACSNEMDFEENGKPVYHPWLTPDHARAVAQIARQEVIDKACEWLEESKDRPLIGCEDPCLMGYLTKEFISEFRKAMEVEK